MGLAHTQDTATPSPTNKDMSAKRRPTSDLNHDNWNEEEEPEETGEFRKASADELKKRVMRIAKRKIATANPSADNASASGGAGGNADTPKTSVFGSFGGFKTDTKPNASPFSFLSAAASSTAADKPKQSVAFSLSTASVPKTAVTPISSSAAVLPKATTVTTSITSSDQLNIERDPIACAKLQALNRSFVEWLKLHVDQTPVCLFTPVFADYECYLQEIKDSVRPPEKNGTSPATVANRNAEPVPTKPAAAVTQASSIESMASHFKFGSASCTKSDATKLSSTLSGSSAVLGSNFSFGSTASSGSSTGFTFGAVGSKPFTFENVAKQSSDVAAAAAVAPKKMDNEDDEYVPPEPEFTPVETDSLYSKRCKVYVKKADDFKSIGVGTLYIKSVDTGKKTQLLVRTDTNQGVVLLNILLTVDTPAKRLGKNNVLLVCLPTPESKPPPSSVLVRVKDGDEADELLDEIKKYRK